MMLRMMTVSLCVGAMMISGCAHEMGEPEPIGKIQEKTAWTLGLQTDDFTISNVQRDGVQTNYYVRTKAGKQYRCYVTSLSGITALMAGGPNMSDAVCGSSGEPRANPLLEAAGKRKAKPR